MKKNRLSNNKGFYNRSVGNRRKGRKRLLCGGVGVFLTILLFYLFLSFYYNSHFYSNMVINGVSTSNMSVKQAEKAINAQVKAYIITLEERNDGSEQIYGENIELETVFDGSVKELLKKQSCFAWPSSLFTSHESKINTMLEYDEALLKKQFKQLKCFEKENVIEPVNAHISEYGENGFEIVPEDPGAKVNKDKLYQAIKKSINALEPTLSLDKEKCYKEPEINSEYPALVEAMNKMNKIAGAKITYEFGEVTEILDGKQISKWISIDDEYKVKLDKKGVKSYVDYIGKTYNSFGRVRTFQTSYTDVIQIEGGDYGWWLDRLTETSELRKLILDGEQLIREPVYFQTAQQFGQDDIGDTYVEINLTAQHLFFYKEGKLIVETDFVSGNISKNNGTPTGTYPIQYKENDATLNGEDYSTPVKYWMPFNGNVGLHDAPWRKKFGEDIYLTDGSHGCINMPPAAALTMFENISRGVAVVVYKLEGTETFDKEEKDNVIDKTPVE